MVDEKNEDYESQGESEYHFSDDQSTYEVEPEAETTSATTAPTAKPSLLDQANKYRRMLIIVVVFIVVLIVVYRLIIPSTTTTPTMEFSDTTSGGATPTPAPTKPLVPTQSSTTTTTTTATTAQPAAPPPAMPAGLSMEQPNPVSMVQPPQSMAMPQPLPNTPPPSSEMVLPPAATPAPAPPMTGSTLSSMPSPSPANMPTTSSPPSTMPVATMPDRVTTLEQQNARIMNVVGTEYAQKIAEYESQNNTMQAKIREMNTRLSNMETTLNQITQMLLNKSGPGPMPTRPSSMMQPPAPPPMMRSAEPRMTYTVQAIIPGRAWLKADNGETVTVAEGDILRDYGRIAKIDPYDGVVEIDTGSKTISLSYGSGTDV